MDNGRLENPVLHKTWLLDLDGTIIRHNSHLLKRQTFTPGALAFLSNIPSEDIIIFLTARNVFFKDITEGFLIENGVRFHQVIYDLPHGARVLINDQKPSGYKTAYAFNLGRDEGFNDNPIIGVEASA